MSPFVRLVTRRVALAGLVLMLVAGGRVGTAHAGEAALIVGLGAGKVSHVVVDDAGYTGMHLSGFVGLQVSRHTAIVLRVARSGGDQPDPFDPVYARHRVKRVMPSVRFAGDYLWTELGLGVALDDATASDDGHVESHTRLGLGLTVGAALAPVAWPVRPHVEAGFVLGLSDAWAGVALVYQPVHRR